MIDGTWVFAATDTVQLFNDWQEVQFVQIGCVLGVCGILIALTQWLLPFFADVVPSRFRLYFLAAVPVIRLALITVAILWIIPLVFNVTFENFLVIAGGASVAIGFAFKDYVSSMIAEWSRSSSDPIGRAIGCVLANTMARCSRLDCERFQCEHQPTTM
ncbi:MAG: mechanosensitive ion channel [Pirellulaceae bacterium]